MLEFTMVLPFLLFLLLAVVDIGVMLSHYLVLTQVAHDGVRLAQQTLDLEEGTPALPDLRSSYSNVTGNGCRVVPLNPEYLPPISGEPPAQQMLVHSRIVSVLCIMEAQGAFAWAPNTGFYGLNTIEISLRRNTGLGPEQRTVQIQILGTYDGIIPVLFTGINVRARASAPYLY